MTFSHDYERPSDAPVAVDASGSLRTPRSATTTFSRWIPPACKGMSGYVIAGVFLGLVLILALGIGRGRDSPAAAAPRPNAVTDNIVRLHAREISGSCWQGYDKLGPARLTVALEIGVDGKIRYAA